MYIEMNIVFDPVGSGDTLFIEQTIVFDLVGSEKIHHFTAKRPFSLWGPYDGHIMRKREVASFSL